MKPHRSVTGAEPEPLDVLIEKEDCREVRTPLVGFGGWISLLEPTALTLPPQIEAYPHLLIATQQAGDMHVTLGPGRHHFKLRQVIQAFPLILKQSAEACDGIQGGAELTRKSSMEPLVP
jgi:hypothetical protein